MIHFSSGSNSRLLALVCISLMSTVNVLWKVQSFSDNHISPSAFLSSLRKNRKFAIITSPDPQPLAANFRPYTYWQLVLLSGPVAQHLATIFLFLAVFVLIKDHLLDPRLLIWLSVACFLAGYILWKFTNNRHTSLDDSK